MIMFMRRVFSVSALLVLLASAAEAQTGLSGYAGAGVAGYSAFFNSRAPFVFVGGGAEVVGGTGVGAGVDAGIFANNSGATLAVLSFDGVVQLRRRPEKGAVPFILGGYTAAYAPESDFSTWNIGGGVTWLRGRRTGIRVEFRDHIRPDFRGTSHYWVLRGGMAFR